MLKTTFTLTAKKQLTHNVFELIYACPDMVNLPPKPGQYVMFQLAPGLNRAYSFASYGRDEFTLIIKRIDIGKGSPIICDAEIGTVFTGIVSLGHFVLQDTHVSKCFIGTGTGFAPLYAMALELQKTTTYTDKIAFLYGVHEEKDSFYMEEMQSLQGSLDLEFFPYFSSDSKAYATTGYVTDWILAEHVREYQEFYICGSPNMVKDARTKLEALGIAKEHIFFEQY